MLSHTPERAAYLRSFIFGVEDSLVSTVGLLSGIAIAGLSSREIFITGVVLIFVEAISMAAGNFLSEASVEEYETRRTKTSRKTYVAGLIMFLSYFASGFIPLAPYLFLPSSVAFATSIILSLGALLLLGYISTGISHTRRLPGMVRMGLVGGLAIVVGVLVGGLVS